MKTLFGSLFYAVRTLFLSSATLQLEIVALRHQLNVMRQSQRGRVHLNRADRVFWVWLAKIWSGWRSALVIVKPETVVAWHRKSFRLYWKWKSKCGPGRSEVSAEVRALIHKMCLANPIWGAPRVHGELLKLGIEVPETTVAKYLPRNRKPPSQAWQTFLKNHAQQLVSVDFFLVPTLSFRLLFVFVVLEHHRRRVVHLNVTAHPTAEWTTQQMLEAFPWDKAPRFQIRDRDGCYGDVIPAGNSRDEHSRSSDGTALSVAKRIRGTANWLDQKRMPRPRDRGQRVLVAENPTLLFSLLRTIKNAFGAGERCAGATSSSISQHWGSGGTARGWWTPPSVRAPSGVSLLA
jgi:hypothetical protein